ncbi:hypothetical protein L7F22_062868 [Adiantum nelumboides]|nr:hypothetical protein [Adiantum nelumboides]
MGLLTQFKLCIRCLPVFSSESPPDSPRPSSSAAAAAPNLDKEACPHGLPTHRADSSADSGSLVDGENPSFSDASLIHDNEQKDLPISQQAKVELVGGPYTHLPFFSKGQDGNAHLDVSDPASKQETSLASTDFSTSGKMPHPSTIAPGPIGLGYILSDHAPSHHIHHQVSSHHNGDHSFFHPHRHNKSHPLSSSPHLTEEKGQTLLSSVEEHESPPLSAFNPMCSPSESSESKHGDPNPQEQNIETSHSEPHINLVASNADKFDDGLAATESSAALTTWHSEPVEAMAMAGRVRRRDHLKHHLKELHGHIKQGGHRLKEEGSRHLQSMVSNNMNKDWKSLE